MAYARASNEHELVTLRDEITKEVNADAAHVARSVFGETADMPDTARISNERLDALYRQAYMRGDRTWLQQEARRDPQQFLKVAERLGVYIPGQQPVQPLPSSGAMPAAPPPQPTVPALPAPMPLAPMAPMPQTLGGGGTGMPGQVVSPTIPPVSPPGAGLLGP